MLDFKTIAAIYLNDLIFWNDTRIKNLNTAEVAGLLPNRSIVVCTQSTSSETTTLFTSVLSATVPEFAAVVRMPWAWLITVMSSGADHLCRTGWQVTSGPMATFPVQQFGGNRSHVANSTNNLMNQLINTTYAFGFARLYDIRLVSRSTLPSHSTVAVLLTQSSLR